MSVEKQIEQSERMSLEEIQRYELPVSFNKLTQLLSEAGGAKGETENAISRLKDVLYRIEDASSDLDDVIINLEG